MDVGIRIALHKISFFDLLQDIFLQSKNENV